MVAVSSVFLAGCGAQADGAKESKNQSAAVGEQSESAELPMAELDSDDLQIPTNEIPQEETIDYMSEAKEQWACGNYEEAAIQYQNAYEAYGNQQALIEILNMWLSQGNDREVKNWVDYINVNCKEMNNELQTIVTRGKNIQWLITNVTYEISRPSFSKTEERIADIVFDEAGEIIQSNIALHDGAFGILENEEAYYTYEYLEDGRVKVTSHNPVAEAANETSDNYNDAYYDIFAYDENGWIIEMDRYRNDELYATYQYSYAQKYDITLGQGGMKTDNQVKVIETYVGDRSRTLTYSYWYSNNKIGMFCIKEGKDDACDEFGNIIYKSSSTTSDITGITTYNIYRIEYVYCTPEEYMSAKQTGDFSAYKIGAVVGDKERTSNIPDALYASYVYAPEDLEMRCEAYLGSDYAVYEPIFKEIVSLGHSPFEGLDDSGNFMITEVMNDLGLITTEGLWGMEENLDEYHFCEIGLDEAGNTMGAWAAYFYEGTKVIYLLNTEEPSFFVVDYSNTIIDENTKLVDFGGVFTGSLYLVPEKCSKQEIGGYTVYFSYNTGVSYEWK